LKPSFGQAMSLQAIRVSAVAAMLLAAAAVSASAQDSDQSSGFFDRLFGGSERAAAPQDRAPDDGQERAATAGTNRIAQAPSSDPVMRIDRLEAQIRQLTGTIEQLQYRNQQLESQLRRMQEDTEYRFQELRGGTAQAPAARGPAPARPPAVAPSVTQPPPTTGATPGRRGDAFDPSQNP